MNSRSNSKKKKRRALEGGGGETRYSRLNADTLEYYRGLHAAFRTALEQDEDEEATTTIIARCFEELGEGGSEVDVVCDAEVSRYLEAFLNVADVEALAGFAAQCLKEDNLGLMCTSSPFGSHVLETLLDRVAAMANVQSGQSGERGGAADGILEQFVEQSAGHLFDMISSKYGSFVARQLVRILAGLPHSNRGDGAAGGPSSGGDDRNYSNRSKYNLADKCRSAAPAGDARAHANPDRILLLNKLTAKLTSDELTSTDLHELQTSAFAVPFLKALLEAMAAPSVVDVIDEKDRADLVVCLLGGNPKLGAESVTADAMYRLMTDRSGSHLVEAALVAAPDALFTKLCTTAFKGRLPELARHQAANFTVQAAISHVKKPQQLKRMYEDLKDSFVGLLRGRRGGIITVLLAAALRVNALQAESAKAVWEAAADAFKSERHPTPLHGILTLDTHVRLGKARGKLSTLGCAMAISLLQFPKGMTKEWNAALEGMSTAELVQVAMDPGGCRVLESYLGHEDTSGKKRDALLEKIQGSWADIACFGSGNKFVERCFLICTDASVKKQIASELAQAEERIAATHRGPGLLQTCAVQAIKTDPDNFEKRVKAAAKTRAEFEQLFGGDGGDGEGGEDGDAKADKKKEMEKADKKKKKADKEKEKKKANKEAHKEKKKSKADKKKKSEKRGRPTSTSGEKKSGSKKPKSDDK